MTLYVNIGATAETEETACHSIDDWLAMLDAQRRGDVAAVERLLAAPPKMLPSASLHPVAAEDPATHAADFWRRYAERNGAAKPAKRGQTQYDVAPNRADPETNAILRRITEGGKS